MKANEVCRRLAGYQDEVVVEVGGLLYRVDSVVRLDGRFIVHTVDDLEETRELLKAIAAKAVRRPPQAIHETKKENDDGSV